MTNISVPVGKNLEYGSKAFVEMEAIGLDQVHKQNTNHKLYMLLRTVRI